MKQISTNIVAIILLLIMAACKSKETPGDTNIIFLHHSTGEVIWNGAASSFMQKVLSRVNDKLSKALAPKALLPYLFEKHNEENNKNYRIEELTFPKEKPYGWNNFPYDYYNIWVKHAGNEPFMEEPTLELLTKDYQIIIFKHCFPVCFIQEDQDTADIDSNIKTLSNYKLQYATLKDKLHEFPETKFLMFTGAAQVEANISKEQALLAKEFFHWVTNVWDQPDDNIFIWDLYSLQTEGGLYFKTEYAAAPNNPHPNSEFAGKVAELLFSRIIDVIETNGTKTNLTGKSEMV